MVAGDDPPAVFAALVGAHGRITARQRLARAGTPDEVPGGWPAIVLRTPKGWTGPDVVDGVQIAGTARSHQVPLSQVRENPAHLARLEAWLRSYQPEEQFDARGRLVPELAALAPSGEKRMSASAYANGGRLLVALKLPELKDYALEIDVPGQRRHETTRPLGEWLREVYAASIRDEDGGGNFRLFCPDETASNRLGAVFEVTDRCSQLSVLGTDESLGPRSAERNWPSTLARCSRVTTTTSVRTWRTYRRSGTGSGGLEHAHRAGPQPRVCLFQLRPGPGPDLRPTARAARRRFRARLR
nr:hypothetical protein [Sporichthya sp.]